MKAAVSKGVLTVTGLAAGEKIRISTVIGQTVFSGVARSWKTIIFLPEPVFGISIVAAGDRVAKVVSGR
ncbi:MAG: DUF6383 domain-containing protein [Dysgonamonadaceae bacterium]|nr:DUF6383 domain-containing protein [Dysgonamonadaceae bacterium]